MSAAGELAAPGPGLLGNREWRAVWASFAVSGAGDRLALVAVTLLVYARTRSPFLSALTFASATIPYLAGGVLLGGLADRVPRRSVMIGCDLARAVLTMVILVPGMPLPALIAVLYAIGVVQPPADAARSAVVRDIFTGEAYVRAVAAIQVTFRATLIAGAAAGGVVVALIGARPAIAVDAVTFAASALLTRLAVRARPAPASLTAVLSASGAPGGRSPGRRWLGGTASGVRLIWRTPALRTVMLLGWLAALYEVPESLAAPYAAADGGGPVAAGLLLASGQAMILAAPWYIRRPEVRRQRQMGPMAVVASGVLVLTALHPGIAGSMVIFALTGAFGVYQVTANTAFVAAVPDAQRAQALTVAATGLVAGQGIAFAAAGWAAQAVTPATVTAVSGAAGALAACFLAASWRRQLVAARTRRPAGG